MNHDSYETANNNENKRQKTTKGLTRIDDVWEGHLSPGSTAFRVMILPIQAA